MRFFAVHLLDLDVDARGEEVVVAIPKAEEPVALKVELDALPGLLPLLRETAGALPEVCCPSCGSRQPARRNAGDG